MSEKFDESDYKFQLINQKLDHNRQQKDIHDDLVNKLAFMSKFNYQRKLRLQYLSEKKLKRKIKRYMKKGNQKHG
jgi:NifU-like protein involved in Fe-S cluster formation